MKRRVVFSESDSDDGNNTGEKSLAVKNVKHTKRHSEKKRICRDIEDNETSCHNSSQQSIIDSLRRQQELSKMSRNKKANTIEAYFSQSVKVKKNEISIDDFFDSSGNKPSNTLPTIHSTPPHSPIEIIPDTPLLSPKSSMHIKENHNSSPRISKSVEKADETHSETTDSATKDRKHFWAYKARDGPRNLGSREIPKGTPDCFRGLNFLITGVLECIERDDAVNLIQDCGGKVLKTLGKKTDYLVVGREPGVAKIEKANNLKIKQITEDQLFELIEKSNDNSVNHHKSDVSSVVVSKSSKKSEPVDVNNNNKTIKSPKISPMKNQPTKPQVSVSKSHNKYKSPNKFSKKPVASSGEELPLTARPVLTSNSSSTKTDRSHDYIPSKAVASIGASVDNQDPSLKVDGPKSSELWVDKYKPNSIRSLIGQNGAQSPANRLLAWLSSWHLNFSSGLKTKAYSSAPPWGPSSSDDGKWARAALLSGPPGIGKTSTAILVCKELGYTYCEFNASDCRSKRCLSEEIGQSLGLRNLSHMAFGQASTLSSGHHVLIMDEVDGMAGNEDRGGMQELINMIKVTQIPIICMCNDRQAIKIRSLANYCLDLRFHRPRVEQIKSALLSITCKEHVNLPSDVLTNIIDSSNHDIRQVINNVQMWCSSGLIGPEGIKADALGARKDLHLNAFDVIRKVFAPDISGVQGSVATFNESLDLFFQDYNLIPLFVEENYLNVKVHNTQDDKKILQLMSQAASDIATADIISSTIRSSRTGSWSLLPIQGVFSTVSPGRTLRGSLPGGPGGVSFPSWFGKNSTQNRISRTASELASHLRLATHCGSSNQLCLLLDYATPIAELITRALKEGDIDTAVQFLIKYQITREDVDAIMELTTWPNRLNRMLNIDSKVKAALTRTYNKSSHLLPYVTSSASSFKRKRGSAVGGTTVSLEGVENDDSGLFEDEEEQDDMVDLKNDAMILVRKEEPKKSVNIGKPKSQVEHTSASSDNNNKGRGRGRGRGRVKD
ncbi:Replication factor C subunit 1 [Schistosoma japonicum]|nr:Replication factor C subunit 1 [Schistosoma japonicum]